MCMLDNILTYTVSLMHRIRMKLGYSIDPYLQVLPYFDNNYYVLPMHSKHWPIYR